VAFRRAGDGDEGELPEFESRSKAAVCWESIRNGLKGAVLRFLSWRMGAVKEQPWAVPFARGIFIQCLEKPLARRRKCPANWGRKTRFYGRWVKKSGIRWTTRTGRGRAFKLRLMGALANSVLQGNLIIDEAEFVKNGFPGESGYRMFSDGRAVKPGGEDFDGHDARRCRTWGWKLTPAPRRLNEFNAVQKHLSQHLPGAGRGWGCCWAAAGLGVVVLRNVQEPAGGTGAAGGGRGSGGGHCNGWC